jgi:hypothetical protein
MNDVLSRTFVEEEVDMALAQMHPLKAPGPDRFGVCFFQKHWPIVGKGVKQAVLNFLNKGIFDPSINLTHIALIPKISNAASVVDFRPISLCNVSYKIIAKVLANRLKGVLSSIISKHQSAFVPGRLISDNIVVAYEALHTMNSRMKGKKGYMAIKLDMSKAYDRVEWSFLEAMMRGLGFTETWISLIMRCVTSVSYSILINGSPFGTISPTRGIRQGDPLSPYLFLLCAEGLSSLIQKAHEDGTISGVPIAAKGFKLSHLFFADDSLLFCRSNFNEWNAVLQVLKQYELASGQKLNSGKTAIFYSKNTGNEFRDFINSSMGIAETVSYEKYLGLPTFVGRSKIRTFAGIRNRVRKRLDGWKEKLLSQAGKEVLIKAVVQSIPTYSMSVFALPKTLCASLNSMMNHFWWNGQGTKKRIHWMSWSRMGLAKQWGGMGFRDLSAFNLALLAKQGWRILQNPNSLVAHILQEKYFLGGSFLQAGLGYKPSYIWRSLLKARPLLESGLKWRIGNGEKVRIWGDKWVDKSPNFQIQTPCNVLDPEARVSSLIDPVTGWWDFNRISNSFSAEDTHRICEMVISPLRQEDKLVWNGAKNGIFTVKTAYHLEMERRQNQIGESSSAMQTREFWKSLWRRDISPALKNFAWRMGNDLLPTKCSLFKKGIVKDPYCPFCLEHMETIFHSLWSCPSSVAVWQESLRRIQKLALMDLEGRGLLIQLWKKLEAVEFDEALSTLRLIWLRRNAYVFDRGFSPPSQLISEARLDLLGYKEAQDRLDKEKAPRSPLLTRWTRPPRGWMKANWAASIDEGRKQMGLGVVVRDAGGGFVAALSKTVPFISDSISAEAIAAWESVKFCEAHHWLQVLFEGDSSAIASALTHDLPCLQSFGHLIADTRHLLGGFHFYKIQHVQRSANQVAYLIAKGALQIPSDVSWMEVCPPFIHSFVMAEQATSE